MLISIKKIKRQRRANKDYMPHEGLTALTKHHVVNKFLSPMQGTSDISSIQFLF